MKELKEKNIKLAYYSLLVWCTLPIVIMLLNPIIKGTSTVYFYMFLVAIGLLGIGNGIIYFKNNKKVINKKIPFLIIILFLVWTFISCLLAQNKGLSLIGSGYLHDGFLSYICYFGFFINGLIISLDKEKVYNVLRMLIISSTLLSICTILFHNFFIAGSNSFNPRFWASIFSNENHYAYYLVISILVSFFYTIYNNKIYGISFLLLSFTLIKNDTFGCFLAVFMALIFSMLYLLIKKKNRLIPFCLIIMFSLMSLLNPNTIKSIKSATYEITMIFKYKDKLNNDVMIKNKDVPDEEVIINKGDDVASYRLICAGNSRLDLWVKGLSLSRKKLLFGYGLENLKSPYSDVVVCDKTSRPHNTFIQILMMTGIIGLLCYLSYLILLFYHLIRKLDAYKFMFIIIILGYLISSFFGLTVFYTTPYFIMLLGFASYVFLKEK